MATCEKCRAALDGPAEAVTARMHEISGDDCGCEAFRLSELSPGPVGDDETLIFILSDPQSLPLFEDGTVRPDVLSQIDSGGLSTLRQQAADAEFRLTLEELRARSRDRGAERFFHGVLTFKAQVARRSATGHRLMCVYDTGLPGKPHHADIMAPSITTATSKSELKRLQAARRHELNKALRGEFVPALAFRDGSFVEFAR